MFYKHYIPINYKVVTISKLNLTVTRIRMPLDSSNMLKLTPAAIRSGWTVHKCKEQRKIFQFIATTIS